MHFQLENFHRDISNEELLEDLKRADKVLRAQGRRPSFRTYADTGKYSAGTFAERFGSWNKALAAAGLEPIEEKNVGVSTLFENLRSVWVAKGKQPVSRDMGAPPPQYGAGIYMARFGSWRSALQEFVTFVKSEDWVKGDGDASCKPVGDAKNPGPSKRKTSRSISERMRFRILLRDGFSCQACGASPLQDRGVELHVDHILPWSKGGETEENNLQTKCKRCNLGKGDAFNQ
jgi:hypothetical protein